ncbi:hypothetical protein DKE41_000855 [Acinetobacter pittii]|nr:hypothetical protein DKE41_000855 [Acinetobacter pittii]
MLIEKMRYEYRKNRYEYRKNAILCFRNAEQSFVRLKDVLSLWILMQLAKPFPTLYVGKFCNG